MPRKNYDKMYEEKKTAEVAPAEESVEVKEETDVKPKPKKTKLPFMGIVTGGLALNVRKTPGGQIIGTVSDGGQVRVLDDSVEGWYQIESPVGFVMSKFIKKA